MDHEWHNRKENARQPRYLGSVSRTTHEVQTCHLEKTLWRVQRRSHKHYRAREYQCHTEQPFQALCRFMVTTLSHNQASLSLDVPMHNAQLTGAIYERPVTRLLKNSLVTRHMDVPPGISHCK